MISDLGGPVFHYGRHEGRPMAEVVLLNPLYILSQSAKKDHGIPSYIIKEAREALEHDDYPEGDEDDVGATQTTIGD